MARPLRIEYPGAVYHVTSRGNARNMIFNDDHDRSKFLKVFGTAVKNQRWLCHAYCLMGNHYHLLIETPEANLSRGMRQLNGIYTQAFNRRHNRSGHLFQGRYKAILVEKERYLLALCRYIVLNPVAAGLVSSPGEWPWSSFSATVGIAKAPEFLTTDWLLEQFSPRRTDVCRRYLEFVHQGFEHPSPWTNLRGGVLLGEEGFFDRFQPQLSQKKGLEEVPKSQRLAHRPQLEDLLVDSAERPSAAREAHIVWGYTLKEIARHWGIHYSTVSRMIR